MQTRNYRNGENYAKVTRPETPVGGVLRLTLPEPPSFNAMIELAKRRTLKTRTGGWMKSKRPLPVVYDQHLEEYELEAMAAFDAAGLRAPAAPWPRWSLFKAHFRLHNERDPIELLASLKWPVDVLVRRGFVTDDSPRELCEVCIPTQEIDRDHRGVDLFIRRDG